MQVTNEGSGCTTILQVPSPHVRYDGARRVARDSVPGCTWIAGAESVEPVRVRSPVRPIGAGVQRLQRVPGTDAIILQEDSDTRCLTASQHCTRSRG